MLKIRVLGKGLIPRGYGLAPRKDPFPADLTLISTILHTPGLEVHMLHPGDGHDIKVTTSNVKKLWDQYSDKRFTGTQTATPKTPAEPKGGEGSKTPDAHHIPPSKPATPPAPQEPVTPPPATPAQNNQKPGEAGKPSQPSFPKQQEAQKEEVTSSTTTPKDGKPADSDTSKTFRPVPNPDNK